MTGVLNKLEYQSFPAYKVQMVQRLTWRESFSVGHLALDEEHRAIIQTINSICDLESKKDGMLRLAPLLQSLVTTTEQHFDHENLVLNIILADIAVEKFSQDELGLMSESVLAEHIGDHARTLKELKLMVEVAQSNQRISHDDICEGLRNWFIGHAIKSDAHLKSVFQAIQVERPSLMSGLL